MTDKYASFQKFFIHLDILHFNCYRLLICSVLCTLKFPGLGITFYKWFGALHLEFLGFGYSFL